MVSVASTTDVLVPQARSLLSGERDPVANAANLSALLFGALEDVNWVGFYFLRDHELVVGPFQGKPACVRIPLGRGVCGTAAREKKVIRVANVEEFADHIVCDAASRSEIVLPLINKGELFGVLDIDSPVTSRFSKADEELLKVVADIYVESIAGD